MAKAKKTKEKSMDMMLDLIDTINDSIKKLHNSSINTLFVLMNFTVYEVLMNLYNVIIFFFFFHNKEI